MKIIQSYWAGKEKSIRNNAGWLSYEYHWMGWILSVNQLIKFYDDVELYTDSFGYDILINKLELPYTKVHIVLDDLNDLPNDFWAMAKIKTYLLQDEPFLHVDGDVFIWDKFPVNLLKKNIIVQDTEIASSYYDEMWANIFPKLNFLPDEVKEFHNKTTNFAYNMGIFGGNDYEAIVEYSKMSSDFVYKNKEIWMSIKDFNFNIFFEQVLLYNYFESKEIIVDVLFEENYGESFYLGLDDFDNIPFNKWYLHLLGIYKQTPFICNKLKSYVFKQYPEYVKRLSEIIPEKFEYINFKYEYSAECNLDLISDFDIIVKEGKIDNLFLFCRDLYFVDMYKKLILKKDDNYTIILLKAYEIIEKENIKYIKIFEIENDFTVKLGKVEEIILFELQNEIKINDLKSKLVYYIEEGVTKDEIDTFLKKIDYIIHVFVKYKLVIVV